VSYGFYEVDLWGDPIGMGGNDARFCTLTGVAKVASPEQRYVVPNEFICGRLALMLNLPVPPGVVVRTDDQDLAYIALRFGPKGELPPPAIPQHLVEDNPSVAAGVVAFDCWVANADRHTSNLAYSRTSSAGLTIFDHGHALLGPTPGQGVDRLTRLRDEPVLDSNCVARNLTTSRNFRDWTRRIGSISQDVIHDLVEDVTCNGGLTPDEGRATKEFLVHRQANLADLIRKGALGTPKISDWENRQ
jgi:hypothetical protein